MLAHISVTQLSRLLGEKQLRAPLYRDLAERLRLLIVDGRLAHGDRLPSERELARALGCSRITVVNAYALVRERGLASSRQGAGTFVSNPRRTGSSPLLPSGLDEDGHLGLTAAATSAAPGVAAAYERAASRVGELTGASGLLPEGLAELRERLADRYTARGLATSPDQIIVTTGCVAALNLVLRTLLSGSRRLLLDSPSYANSIELALAHRARPVTVPLTGSGWDVARMAARVRQAGPGLAYLIPDFHNPTGLSMDDATRAQVASLLARGRVVTIVDETLVDLDFGEVPPALPLAAHDRAAVTIGSASKSWWGGLRVGWIRAPHALVEPLIRRRYVTDLGTPPFEQLVCCELLQDPRVLDEQRALARARRDHLATALAAALPDWRFVLPPGGLSLWVELPTPDSSALVRRAEQVGLTLTPGPRFFADGGGERHLRLPYVCEPGVLDEAVRRTHRAWAGLSASSAGADVAAFSA